MNKKHVVIGVRSGEALARVAPSAKLAEQVCSLLTSEGYMVFSSEVDVDQVLALFQTWIGRK